MADSKYKRILQLFPNTFRPQDGDEVINNLPADSTAGMTIAELWQANVQNPVLNAVLRGFAQADDEIATALDATKASLFVRTSENQQLDVIASSLGVSRPGSLGISDTAFQNLIPPLSLRAKQVRESFYNAMDAFYGPEFSRANLITVGNAPFDIGFTSTGFNPAVQDTITFTVDNGTSQSFVVRSANVASPGQATALELNTLITDNITGVTSEIITDPITTLQTVRVRTNSPGLRGSLLYSSNRRTTNTLNLTVLSNDQATRTIEVAGIGIFQENDVITISETISFTVLNVQETGGNSFLLLNDGTSLIDPALPSLVTQNVRNEAITLFPTDEAQLIKQEQRTAVYELTPNNVIIELPAVLPSLERGLRGSLHVHNGPLLNNLIFRGETVTTTLPDSLFENSTAITALPTDNLDPTALVIASVSGNTITVTGDITQLQVGDIISIFDSNLERVIGTETVTNIDGQSAIITAIPTTGSILPMDMIVGDTISQVQRPNFYTVTSNETWISYNANTRILTFAPPAGQDVDVYEYTVANSVNAAESFKAFTRVDNRLAPATDQQIWEGAYIFDPSGIQTPFTVTGASAIITGDAITGADTLAAGRVFPRVNVVASTNTLPETSGLAVVGFGSSTQEPSLIRYRGRAADDIIELDPSFVFTNSQPSGTYINIVSTATPFVPDRTGQAYPIYLTSSTEARIVVQGILSSLAAAGVVVTFVALAPDYTYLIDNPYLTDDDAPVS